MNGPGRRPAAGRRTGIAARIGLLILGACLCREPALAACEVAAAARLPLASRDGHVYTTARIQGVDATLLVDTGSAVTMLDAGLADRLKLDRGRTGSAVIVGIGGRDGQSFATLSPARVELGALTLPAVEFVRGELNRGRPAGTAPVDGLLGTDILARYDVEFDPAQGRLDLHAVRGCAGDFLGWPVEPSAIPMKPFFQERLKTVPVTIDGHAVSALVDTGASQSVLFDRGVAKLGAAARRGRGDRAGYGVGATAGRRVDVRLHRFQALRLGRIVLPDPDLAIARTNPLDLDMVLGLDVLGQRHVWVSYATGQLFIAGP